MASNGKNHETKGRRFARLHLENWRNFLNVDMQLQQRVFLVGPNASGKSNLLDVFRFLSDIVSVGGGFQQAINRRGGVSMLRCLAARQYPDIAIHAEISSDNDRDVFQYELHFAQDNQRRPLVKRESVIKNGQELLKRPNPEDNEDPERLTQTYLEQVNVNKDFRDIVEFFGMVRYLHIVPQLVREPDRSVGKQDDPYGGDFLEHIAKAPEKTRNARLREIQKALKVAVPQLTEIELKRDHKGTPHLRGKYEHWRPQGAWQSEDHFSDGTLRLLGLLWSVLDGRGPLLLEEPELSLHSEVVRFLPQMFARINRRAGRQVILSTHSADLLRDEGIGLDEVFLLTPGKEGSRVRPASELAEVRYLLEGGVSLPEAVIPHTRPEKAEQLTLFPEQI